MTSSVVASYPYLLCTFDKPHIPHAYFVCTSSIGLFFISFFFPCARGDPHHVFTTCPLPLWPAAVVWVPSGYTPGWVSVPAWLISCYHFSLSFFSFLSQPFVRFAQGFAARICFHLLAFYKLFGYLGDARLVQRPRV